jgi:peptidyl-prolyl cis-trans isomerase C
MRVHGDWRHVLAACVLAVLQSNSVQGQAQDRPPPPGAVGMESGPPPAPADQIVANVDGHPIYLSAVGDEIHSMPAGLAQNSFARLFPLALRHLIEREALVIKALQVGIANEPNVGRHMQEASDMVLANAYLEHVAAPAVTEQTLLARYDAEIKGKPGPEEVQGQVILLPTEAAATEIIAKLAGGADFAGLARQFSKDPTSRNGGELGFVRRENLSPEGAAALFTLRPGEVTPYPVETPFGWFVMKAEARRVAPSLTFGEARDQLRTDVIREAAADVLQAALTHLTVEEYNLNGKRVVVDGTLETPADGQ